MPSLLGELLGALFGIPAPRERARASRARRRNPVDSELVAAQRLSREFHGTSSEVIELTAKERRLPRYVVALGEIPSLEYAPRRGSQRGNAIYVHESGDRGMLAGKSAHAPVLAADPKTRRPLIVPMQSPVRFSGKKGLWG